MEIRSLRAGDLPALVDLSRECARGESDFVLNPLWETREELEAEFERFGISAEQHVLVADAGDGEVLGMVGFLREPGAREAGMFCPIVKRGARGRGVGGELLRAAQELAVAKLGIQLATAGIGTRNRAGYSLLTSHGFRPTSQAFLMRCEEAPPEPYPPESGGFEPARADDAAAVLLLYHECGFPPRSAEHMARVLDDGRHEVDVARRDGRIVAFVELQTHWPRRPWVSFVGVERSLRSRGTGTAIVSWAVRRQFERGAEACQLMLSPANRSGLRAYEKVGLRRHRLVDVLAKALS